MGIILGIFALTRPQWGFHWEEIKRVGVDVMVAIDVSESMLAEDVKPNRLERAKREVIDLIEMLEGDRIGLIAFAGTSFVQCPLTLDYGACKMFLDYIDTDLIPVPGTAVAEV
ncbi:MAG: VWA domain-containing protein, partial [Deltaproteobacteria bacterium]|nr:VWA domain-containing protein [Deltaproteobacteria bacterium]